MDDIFVTQPDLPPLNELIPLLEEIWKKKNLTNSGDFHNELETELAKYLGVPYVSLFSNGTLALMASLDVLEIKGKVITTPYSFVATSNALLYKNLEPVFVDIDEETLNLDPKNIEEFIDDETTAIMPVHVYGIPCDVEKIEKIATKYNLKVIYDAAHSFGVNYKGNSILGFGDLSILSFHATKSFNTFEGGAVIAKDISLKKKLDKFRNFGFESETNISTLGINAKMNEFQAAIGLLNLKYYDEKKLKRKEIDSYYRRELDGLSGIKVFYIGEDTNHNYSYFPIFIQENSRYTRDELYEYLRNEGIMVRRYFYPIIPDFELYKNLPFTIKSSLDNARKASESVICLPMYSEMDLKLANRVINTIKNFELNQLK